MNGFTPLDIANFRYLVYKNLVQGVYQLVEGAKTLDIPVSGDVEVSQL
jgi:hypothetical protein